MASPVVVSKQPAANSLTADPSGNITVTFDQGINGASVTDASVVVHGYHGQLLTTEGDAFSAAGSQAVVNPGADLLAGEKVQVSVTGAVQNGGAEGAVTQVWNFSAAATAGSGSFVQGQDLGGGNSRGVAIGDLDDDGDLDVVFGNYSGGSKIWFNDGTATFTVSAQTLTSNTAQSVHLGDFDGDGDLDLVEGINNDPNQVWINNGSGTFTAGQGLTRSATSDGSTSDEAIADLDGDGDLDIFDANNFTQEAVIWLNDGSATFTRAQLLAGSTDGQDVVLADVDGDGDIDAIEAANVPTSQVWINDGAGSFSAGQVLDPGVMRSVDAADIDGDGDVDLVLVTNNGQSEIWTNDGAGSFSEHQLLGSMNAYAVHFADVNADGMPDLLIALQNGGNNQVRLNNGSGVFGAPTSFGGGNTDNVAAGDLDGDGDIDLVFANDSGGTNQVWLNRGGADIEIALSESADPVLAESGGTLTYVATVSNQGPEDATGLVINQALSLPTGVNVATAVPSVGTYTGPGWNIGNLNAGNSATLTITLNVGPSAVAGTDIISGTTTISAINEPRSDPSDDRAQVATSVTRQVDLVVTAAESTDPVIAGSGPGNLVHTVTLRNNGPSDASGIQIEDVLVIPAGASIGSVVPSAGSFTAPDWTVPTLAAGDNATLTVSIDVAASAAVGTDVVQSSASLTTVAEPQIATGDESAAVATSIDRQVDLVIVKTESVDPVIAGSGAGNLVHTVTVTNNGPSDASGVMIADVLTVPAGVSVDSTVPSLGSFSAPDWSLPSLPAGTNASLTTTMTAGPSAMGGVDVINDSAQLGSANETLLNTGNDAASVATSIQVDAGLLLAHSGSPDPVIAGEPMQFSLSLTNQGPADVVDAVVTDALPSGTVFVGDDCGAGPPAGSTLTWNLGAVPVGSTATCTVTLDTSPDAAGSLSSTATAMSSTPNPNGPQQVTATVAVSREADLVLTMSGPLAPPQAVGDSFALDLGLTNQGPSSATGTQVSVGLPANVTYVSDTCGGSLGPGGFSWPVGHMNPGDSLSCSLQLQVAGPGRVQIGATATSNEIDTTPANASAGFGFGILSTVTIPAVGLFGLGLVVVLIGFAASRWIGNR